MMPEWLKALLLSVAIILGIAFIVFMTELMWPAHAAGPPSKWGHDEETSAWFRSLQSPSGFPCCDYSDGNRIEDPGDYRENEDGSYDVKYAPPDKWVHVPKERIVTIPNKVGYAILWMRPGATEAFCFMPGNRV